jgi:hypothetical protein
VLKWTKLQIASISDLNDQAQPCPAGSHFTTVKSRACVGCPDGKVSIAGALVCGTTCPLGTYKSGAACTLCPEGRWGGVTPGITKAAECDPCDRDWVPDQYEAIGLKQVATTHGYHCPPGSITPTQHKCPRGSYCDASTTTRFAVPCPKGTYNDQDLQSAASSCIQCHPGQFQDSAGLSSCKACSPGKYGDQAKQTSAGGGTGDGCKNCGAGNYNYAAGASEASQCTKCAAGTFGTSSTATSAGACTACEVGKANPQSGQNTTGACVNCVAGRYQGLLGKATCIACAAGKYGDQSGQTAVGTGTGDGCKNCDVGTYSSALGAASLAQCNSCPAGKASNAVGQTAASTCINCITGRYSAEGGSVACIPCDTDKASVVGQSVCLPCKPGEKLVVTIRASSATSASTLVLALLRALLASRVDIKITWRKPRAFSVKRESTGTRRGRRQRRIPPIQETGVRTASRGNTARPRAPRQRPNVTRALSENMETHLLRRRWNRRVRVAAKGRTVTRVANR